MRPRDHPEFAAGEVPFQGKHLDRKTLPAVEACAQDLRNLADTTEGWLSGVWHALGSEKLMITSDRHRWDQEPTMSKPQHVKEEVQRQVNELKRLRDEIVLDIHLATMDLRDEWREIEKRLPGPTQVFEDLKSATLETVETLGIELRRFRNRLRKGSGGQLSGIMARDVATCASSDSLAHALSLMWSQDVGCLPVVDGHGRVLGIITDRDAAMAAATRGRLMDDIKVDSVMATAIVSCSAWDSAEEALGRMRAARIRRIPVIGEDGALAGMVSLNDIARASPQAVLSSQVLNTLLTITEPRQQVPTCAAL